MSLGVQRSPLTGVLPATLHAGGGSALTGAPNGPPVGSPDGSPNGGPASNRPTGAPSTFPEKKQTSTVTLRLDAR